jgi:hypothetical protein
MTADRPYELDHIPPRLHTAFDGRVPPGTQADPRQRENNFLTRALAAFAVMHLTGCTADEAAAALVDGGGDGGIDAVRYAPTSNTLWLVQSKFFDTGRGEPDLGDVSKFRDGVADLLRGNWPAFQQNPAWVAKLPDIQRHFTDPSLRVRAVLVYSGLNTVSDGRLVLFEQLAARHNQDDDYFRFSTYNLVSVHGWLTGAEDAPGVERVELDVLQPGLVTAPYKTIYGRVRLADVAELYKTHGVKLVDANLRRYKGLTDVNKRIRETLTGEPQHFFYLNNGLTAYCQQFDIAPLDRPNTEKKRITARRFSIVNGAQTLGTIHASEAGGDGFVFLKVVSLENCDDEAAFARRITESTNFQNQISPRDFASLNEQHERIAQQLRLDGVHYHYKEADDVPDSDDANFTLEDAATALACLEGQADCGICAMLLSNRKALWSGDLVYPKENPETTLCQRLFRPERSARAVWRAVQVRRIVIDQLKAQRPAQGVLRDFYENSRWVVLHLLLLREKLEQGPTLALTEPERARAVEQTLVIADAIWRDAQGRGLVSAAEPYTAPRHFKSVFCSADDCKALKAGAMRRLSQNATSPPAGGATEGANP